jgi:glycerate 2-kinase
MNEDVAAAHEAITRWFTGALAVVDPQRAVADAITFDGSTLRIDDRELRLDDVGNLVVLAIGKAANGMARGARDVIGDRITRGIILTKRGHLDGPVEGFDAFEAGHPLPDEDGLAATRVVLDAVRDLSDRDCVIALISGGGSALLELPRDGLSLEDMQVVSRQLMHAGAGIHDLNTVRKALSAVKGGGLRRAVGEARCVSLLLSDVMGNDPSVIASGPTVLSASTADDAQVVIERFGLGDALGDRVRHALTEPAEAPVEIDTSGDVVSVVADNALFVNEIAKRASDEGLRVDILTDPYDGDAGALGREIVQRTRDTGDDVDVIVRGGEATVTVTGDGRGGRNTEMALIAALELPDDGEWIIASLATDGDDGNSGAAGAIADAGTVARARRAGVDPDEALRRNDSASVFEAAGGLVVTGPTGTNVNDVYIAMRTRAGKRETGR